MNAVFKAMFPDSKLLVLSFQFEITITRLLVLFKWDQIKLHYYVTFGLAPYMKFLRIDTQILIAMFNHFIAMLNYSMKAWIISRKHRRRAYLFASDINHF